MPENYDEEIEKAHKEAWSIENMPAHGAAGRSIEYIGSEIRGYIRKNAQRIYDYYKDNTGAYWYKSRVLLSDGEIVNMEKYIFGKEVTKRHKKGV